MTNGRVLTGVELAYRQAAAACLIPVEQLRQADSGKKLFVRLAGAGFLAFAVHFARGVADLIQQAR